MQYVPAFSFVTYKQNGNYKTEDIEEGRLDVLIERVLGTWLEDENSVVVHFTDKSGRVVAVMIQGETPDIAIVTDNLGGTTKYTVFIENETVTWRELQ